MISRKIIPFLLFMLVMALSVSGIGFQGFFEKIQTQSALTGSGYMPPVLADSDYSVVEGTPVNVPARRNLAGQGGFLGLIGSSLTQQPAPSGFTHQTDPTGFSSATNPRSFQGGFDVPESTRSTPSGLVDDSSTQLRSRTNGDSRGNLVDDSSTQLRSNSAIRLGTASVRSALPMTPAAARSSVRVRVQPQPTRVRSSATNTNTNTNTNLNTITNTNTNMNTNTNTNTHKATRSSYYYLVKP